MSTSSPSDEPYSKKRRFKRTRTGCLTCRARRVKCDEKRPTCDHCDRISTTCRWQGPKETEIYTPSTILDTSPPPVRRSRLGRRQPACNQCRSAKAKCSHTQPVCARCTELEQECVWPGTEGSIATSPPRPPPLPLHSDILATGQELRTLIDAYFSHVHPIQGMSFLPQSQVCQDVENGGASRLLVKAMCAVSARFLDNADSLHPDGGRLPGIWAQQVKNELMLNTERISTSKLAATLCLLHHEFNSGRMLSAWMFMALAARMALAMGLDKERRAENDYWVKQETARRLMWATLCFDVLGSSAFAKYALLPRAPSISLPSGGMPSALLSDGVRLDMEFGSVDGAMALWVRLMILRRDILAYVQEVGNLPLRPWAPNSGFAELCARLYECERSMSGHLEYSVPNLYRHDTSTSIGSLVGLHLLYDLIYLSLHRIAFPDHPTRDFHTSLADAPTEWLHARRLDAYRQALKIQQRFKDVEQHFPKYVSTSRLWTRSVLASIRAQLDYAALHGSEPSRSEMIAGFSTLVRTVKKMMGCFSSERKMLRDILILLDKHGFNLLHLADESVLATRPNSPSIAATANDANVPALLTDIPWMRRRFYGGDVEDVVKRNGESSMRTTIPAEDFVSGQALIEPPAHTDPVFSLDSAPFDPVTADLLVPGAGADNFELDDIFNPLWAQFQPDTLQPQGVDPSDLNAFLEIPEGWT